MSEQTAQKKSDGIFSNPSQDLPAGLVVFLVALPLCLGIALASGAPLFSGVIAGIVGGLIVGALSGSQLGVSGPAAGLAVIVLVGIQDLGFEVFLLAVLIGGAVQLLSGFLNAGIIGYYFPSSVIKGMLAGIGVLLILKQIPHALGYDRDPEGDWSFLQTDGHNTLSEIYYSLVYNSPGAIIITALSLGVLILWGRKFIQSKPMLKKIPAPLLVVVLGVVTNQIFVAIAPRLALGNEAFGEHRNNHLVDIPSAGSFDGFLNLFTLPDFSAITNPQVWTVAITIAIVASLETLLCVEATDKLDPHKRVTPTNQELRAQGIGNMISGLIGGLPVTQVIVRSSANINAGGQTRLSAIFHGFLLFACVLAIPGILNMIPLASLAAILLLIGYKLAKVSLFKEMYALGTTQFVPFFITIVGIVFTDLLKGIVLGITAAIFFIIREHYRNAHSLHREEFTLGSRMVMTLSEEVSFINKGDVLRTLHEEVPSDSKLRIDGTRNRYIDYDVLEVIRDFAETAHERNIHLEIVGFELGIDYIKPEIKPALRKAPTAPPGYQSSDGLTGSA